MNKLPLITLVRMWRDFLGKEWDFYSKEEKINYINKYRKVEIEHENMIAKYGSVEAWYLSGEGRLLEI